MVVSQYMNPHLVYLRDGDRVEIALGPILQFGLSAIPILDDEHHFVGMVTLRELAASKGARPQMVTGARTIARDATVETAAQMMAQDNVHHLVVVDLSGVAVGMLSSLDIVRALLDLPARHPESTRRFALQADGDIQSEFGR